MGASNKVCPVCGRKMKQQFIGLQHCKCGMSWKKDIGYFERTGDMVFALERRKVGKKTKQCPVIRYRKFNTRNSVRAVIDRKQRFVAALFAFGKLLDKKSRSGKEKSGK